MNGDSNGTPDDDRDLSESDSTLPVEVTAVEIGAPDDDTAGVTSPTRKNCRRKN